jgi:hypothetical protein
MVTGVLPVVVALVLVPPEWVRPLTLAIETTVPALSLMSGLVVGN